MQSRSVVELVMLIPHPVGLFIEVSRKPAVFDEVVPKFGRIGESLISGYFLVAILKIYTRSPPSAVPITLTEVSRYSSTLQCFDACGSLSKKMQSAAVPPRLLLNISNFLETKLIAQAWHGISLKTQSPICQEVTHALNASSVNW